MFHISRSTFSFNEKFTNILVVLLLATMFFVGFFSFLGKNATMDEVAHIPAGYSYVTEQDYRLNPEHPPLLKDLAGLTLLGQNINFPAENKAWAEEINGQWDWGFHWLYEAGNDPDRIVMLSRLPFLLITLLLGFYIFQWTKELYGKKAGLLALFLFALSPTFIAHGRLVTTDVGAALGFFAATYHFWHYLKYKTWKHLVFAGLALGIAQLLKFSLFLLIPFLSVIALLWVIIHGKFGFCKRFWKMAGAFTLILIIGYALIWPVYQYHVANYPPERQKRDAEFILSSHGNRFLANSVVWMSDKPFLRAYGQYGLGLLMVTQRAAGGNTTFFQGDVSSTAWPQYFLTLYFFKIPLPFHILTFIALAFGLTKLKQRQLSKRRAVYEIIDEENNHREILQTTNRFFRYIKKCFPEITALLFLALYWFISITSNLNIGVRHILPTLPFLYLLVAGQVTEWVKEVYIPKNLNVLQTIKSLIFTYFAKIGKTFLLLLLILWYAAGTILAFPHYIPFYNEAAGGPRGGAKIAVDSNLDWGQDLKNLAKFTEKNNIEKIKLNYFGGGKPDFYLDDKFVPYDPIEDGEVTGWLAVSATLLQQGRAQAVKGFDQPTTYYNWLNNHEPVEIIGHSIFVYNIK